MLQTSLAQFFSNGTAKTKLAILVFLYGGKFVKTLMGATKNLAGRKPFLDIRDVCNLTFKETLIIQ